MNRATASFKTPFIKPDKMAFVFLRYGEGLALALRPAFVTS
jgi:hypothetical protein